MYIPRPNGVAYHENEGETEGENEQRASPNEHKSDAMLWRRESCGLEYPAAL